MSKLFIIFTTEEGGSWQAVQGLDDEETKRFYVAGGFASGDQYIKFYWKALTRLMVSDYAPEVREKINQAKKNVKNPKSES